MQSHPKFGRSPSLEQAAFALLLWIGMFFPSSINGEHSVAIILAAFVALFILLAYLAYKQGIRRKFTAFVSLPIMIILAVCTLSALINRPIDIDLGLFLKFSALALVLSLDLRSFRPSRLVTGSFVLVNLLNIAGGIAILVGSQWISDFLPKYYWTSYPELVPSMVALHKPVLTFGSHSLAGLFIYLFFWVNWEDHRLCRNRLALFFAMSNFILLVGLTSFTSFGFAVLALAQMCKGVWEQNRKIVIAIALCIAALIPLAVRVFADQIDIFIQLPELAEKTMLNTETNGPLSRYGPDGALRAAMTYLFDHPLSPIGLTRSGPAFAIDSPSHFLIADSGPLEYMLRGSVPLLFLIYYGLYRFLRHNLVMRIHGTVFFSVIIVFEVGFSALDSSRTFFLLPFLIVYLNHVALSHASQAPQEIQFQREFTLQRNSAVT
jgi:hypothetical protein